MVWQAGLPPADWDESQFALRGHFMQGTPWAQFQQALGRQVFYAHGAGWSWLAILEKNRLGKRLYCPYGPTYDSAAAFKEALATLHACASAQQTILIRIEPQGSLDEPQLQKLGLQRAPRDIQPHYTLVKDLTPETEEVLSEMTSTNRNLYRTAANKGLTFRSTNNPAELPLLLDMLHEVAERNSIRIHSDEYFTTMAKTLFPLGAATLYLAEHDGRAIAASLVFDGHHTRYYAHAAAYYETRKLHAGTPLVAQMIFDAKEAGREAFDFCGITISEDPNHPWAGLSKFKQSFGGQVVDMHGTWELGIRKAPYQIYTALRRLNDKIPR